MSATPSRLAAIRFQTTFLLLQRPNAKKSERGRRRRDSSDARPETANLLPAATCFGSLASGG